MANDLTLQFIGIYHVLERECPVKIIQRLYLREFFTLLFLLVAGLSLIFSLVDLTGKIHGFMPGKPSATNLLLYSIFTVPKFLIFLLPMSVLISGMFTFSQASRRKEITAIKAAGGRLRSLFYPFIAVGILLGLMAFATGEILAPDFTRRAVNIKNYLEGNAKKVVFDDGSLWLRSLDGSPVKIDLYNAEKKMAKGLNIFVLGEDFLKERITAEKAFWDGRSWVLEDVTRYNIGSGTVTKLKTMPYQDLESPDLFAQSIKTTDEMDIAEMYHYMQRLKKAGFRNIKLAVDINSKVSFPLINIFMMLLGISLALQVGLGGGMLSAGLGLIISLVYGFSYTFFLSMGYAGILHPLIAAWIMPLLFSVLSIYLFLKIPE
jgi:lipopolysaccharide export system permease protein